MSTFEVIRGVEGCCLALDDAQIAANDNLPAEFDISADGHACNDTETVDSRERLEADVRGAVHGAYAYEDYIPEDMIIGWLDRQAEITERETVKQWEEQASELVCKINELTAERDELQSIIDHMPKTEAECEACQEAHDRLMFNSGVEIGKLIKKLADKQHVCDVQRDSFLKLETENAKLRKELDECSR